MLQFISLPLKTELISDTNAQLIQNSVISYHKNQERTRKKNEKGKKGKSITGLKKRRQNHVAAFLGKAEWINETAPKSTSENIFLKKSSKYWL